MFELVGLILQTIGIALIVISQMVFYFRVRRKWGSLKRGFLDLTSARAGVGGKAILVMDDSVIKELFNKFPLASFLYDDFVASVVGLIFSLIGTLLLFV